VINGPGLLESRCAFIDGDPLGFDRKTGKLNRRHGTTVAKSVEGGSRVRSAVLTRAAFLGIAIGFVVGIAGAVYFVAANRYIPYGMLRLTVLVTAGSLNTTVPLFAALLVALSALYLAIDMHSRTAAGRFLRFGVMAVLLVIAVQAVRWFAFPLQSLPWCARKLAGVSWSCITGETSLGSFLSLLRARLGSGSVLIGAVVGVIVLWLVISRVDLERLGGIVRKRCDWKSAAPMLAALLALNVGILIDARVNMPESPNVVLIGIDTWRADHVSSYGYGRATTPCIDEVAEQGAYFTRAFSTTSWTLPSFQSILTGLYVGSHGVINGQYRLAYSHNTLAELLRDRGYTTAGFISGTYLKKVFGFDQGFDVYEESVTRAKLMETFQDITSPELTRLVLPWIKRHSNGKFFLFIHYWDPHFDYIPPPPYDQLFDPYYTGDVDGTNFQYSPRINADMDRRDLDHIIALYDGEIRWTDFHIGKLLTTLDDLGLMDRTVVVLVGDHGEEFFEHGFKGHRKTLYNEVIHIPLMMRGPGIRRSGDFDTVVSTVDILPTVLDLLKIDCPTPLDGESLIPIISGEATSRHVPWIISELGVHLTTVIKDRWKIIQDSNSRSLELYNLFDDPDEARNQISQEAAEARELSQYLGEWLRIRERRTTGAPRAITDRETVNQLKALGYIQ
jgi:arylsulfatase A-like enzyme